MQSVEGVVVEAGSIRAFIPTLGQAHTMIARLLRRSKRGEDCLDEPFREARGETGEYELSNVAWCRRRSCVLAACCSFLVCRRTRRVALAEAKFHGRH